MNGTALPHARLLRIIAVFGSLVAGAAGLSLIGSASSEPDLVEAAHVIAGAVCLLAACLGLGLAALAARGTAEDG